MSSYDVAIVGAGAAGLGAAKTLAGSGLGYVVLEASHRIGGRAYTEEIAPGVPFDLGCHWLHSASLNPFVEVADAYGLHYEKGTFGRRLYFEDHWASGAELAKRDAYVERAHSAIEAAAGEGRDVSIYEVVDPEEPWASLFNYWVSLATSADSDRVSVMDFARYRDTGEDWPLEEGYGTLIARFGADVPVALNHAVEAIHWGGKTVRLTTPKGEVEARCVILTVSTGVLGAGTIRFEPALPAWKQEAIAALPLGDHNRIAFALAPGALDPETPPGVSYVRGEEQMWFRLRPFGHDQAVGVTGGRFARWLERAGERAQADFAEQCLKGFLGTDIGKRIVARKVTAWGGDPWVRGAYSAARPGEFRQRAELARALDDRLHFAGEATSPEFFATAHGAYLTGVTTATQVIERLSGAVGPARDRPPVS